MRENAEWICRENSRLFMLLSRVHRTIPMMLFSPIHSWAVFLVAVEYFHEEPLRVLPNDFALSPSGNRRRTGCRQEMAIVRVLIVSVEPRFITEGAFGNCEKH
jgi:hypothetical protein